MKPLLLVMLIILSAGAVGLASSARPSLCATLHAGFLRRQMQEFGWNQAFPVGMDPTHTPYVTFAAKGRNATVTIGDGNEPGGKYHVMIPSDVPNKIHFIGHIYVFDQNDEIIANRNLDPTDPSPATLTFPIPPGTTSITAYQFCNIHGLWKGEKTAVPLQYIFDAWGGDAWGGIDYGYKCSLHQPEEMCFMSHHAEMIRRQFFVFNKYAPFKKVIDKKDQYVDLLGESHTPIIELGSDKRSGQVLVGNYTGEIHPMIASIGGSAPHWIEMLYVVDQDDTVIAMKALDPTDSPFMGIMHFSIPDDKSVTKVKGIAQCNVHGLWEGPYVEVVTRIETDDTRIETDDTRIETDDGGNYNDGVIEGEVPDGDKEGVTISSGNHNSVFGMGIFQVLCLVLLL